MSVAELDVVPEYDEATRRATAPRTARKMEARAVFVSLAALYIAVGAILVFHYDSVSPDALSRVGNATYVLFSRDPKLAAIGFVWTPLPSLLMLPFLPLKFLWPALVRRGFIANIESAVCMALAAVVLDRCLDEQGVRRPVRLVLVALFALNPFVLYYGANGMSEALLLLLLMGATRWLARWMSDGATFSLARVGVYLALAYLARYEAIAAGVAAMVLVGLITWSRTAGSRRERGHAATADAALVAMPFVLAVVGFAVASWTIVGHPFETFSSMYGNSAQVATAASGIASVHGASDLTAVGYLARQLLLLEPGLIVLVPMALFIARRRAGNVLAPVVVYGSVLVFQELAFIRGSSFGWLRFQIMAIPMVVMITGFAIVARLPKLDAVGAPRRERWRRTRHSLAQVAMVSLVAAGVFTAPLAMADRRLGREEHVQLLPAVERALGYAHPIAGTLHEFTIERKIAAALDRMHLADGSVLTDAAISFPIILASSDPHQFVITSDRDFAAAVAYPAANGVRYVLASRDPNGLDAVAAAYPSLYDDGAGIAHLVADFPSNSPTARSWRIYQVTGP